MPPNRFVIYDDVNYIKGGWVNRNRILVNGEPDPHHRAFAPAVARFKRICDTTPAGLVALWREQAGQDG